VEAVAAHLLSARLRSFAAARGAPLATLGGWCAVVTYARGDHAAVYVGPDGATYASKEEAAAALGLPAADGPAPSPRLDPATEDAAVAAALLELPVGWNVGGGWPSEAHPPRGASASVEEADAAPAAPPPLPAPTPDRNGLLSIAAATDDVSPMPARPPRAAALANPLVGKPGAPPTSRVFLSAVAGPASVAPARGGTPPPTATATGAAAAEVARLAAAAAAAGGRLAPGWTADVRTRRDGASRGAADIYFYAPDGSRFRSVAQALRAVGLVPGTTPRAAPGSRLGVPGRGGGMEGSPACGVGPRRGPAARDSPSPLPAWGSQGTRQHGAGRAGSGGGSGSPAAASGGGAARGRSGSPAAASPAGAAPAGSSGGDGDDGDGRRPGASGAHGGGHAADAPPDRRSKREGTRVDYGTLAAAADIAFAIDGAGASGGGKRARLA
jgi:hypothetical protein